MNTNNNHKKNYAYVRVSSEEQKKGYSIENQKMTVTRVAESQGLILDHIYQDEAKSAFKENVKRRGLDDLLAEVKANRVNYIIIWKLDRLIRNHIKNERLFIMFKEHNVEIISCTEGRLTFDTADGRANVRRKGVENQYESERTSERVKAALFTSAELGNYPKAYVHPAFRRIHSEYAAAPIVPDEIRGKEFRYIYTKILEEKWGSDKTIEWLNSNNYMGINWNEKFFYKVIADPINIGTYVNNLNNPELSIKNHTPPNMPEEEFNEVLAIIHGRHYDRKYKYLFKGFMYCVKCDRKLTPNPAHNGHSEKLFLYYHCDHCKKRVNQDRVFEKVNEIFNSKIKDEYKYNVIEVIEKKIVRIEHLMKKNNLNLINLIIDEKYHDQQEKKLLDQRLTLLNDLKKYKIKNNISWDDMKFNERRKWIKQNINKIYYDFTDKTFIIKYR